MFAVRGFNLKGFANVHVELEKGRGLSASVTSVVGADVACLGIALGVLGSNLIEAEQSAIEIAKDIGDRSALAVFEEKIKENEEENASSAASNTIKTSPDHQEYEYDVVVSDGTAACGIGGGGESRERTTEGAAFVSTISGLVIAVSAFFTFSLMFDTGHQKTHGIWANIVRGLYFSVVTSTTVGYGDLVLETQLGRLVFVLIIPLAVGIIGHWLGTIASNILERSQVDFHSQLAAEELE